MADDARLDELRGLLTEAASLPDRAADREREPRRGTWVEITDECNGSDCDGCGECWTPAPAALAARPAPDDGEAVLPRSLGAASVCTACGVAHGRHKAGCRHLAPPSPPPDALRQAVADELARHASTMAYTRDDETVRLGCRCGHDRGAVTKAELASDLDGRMRAYRLHVADAVIGVIEGHQP